MTTVTNHYNVPLLMAVWLLNDDYDHDNSPKTISASALIKPLKKFILGKRVNRDTATVDVADLMASALGSAIHDSLEAVWLDERKRTKALTQLGVPADVQKDIMINPTAEEVAANPDKIFLYFEQRAKREFKGWTISGKFDQIADGRVQDTKSTGVFSFMKGNKDTDYRDQLSIYKWLNPDKVTDPIGQINFVFTDWQGFRARQDPNYPEKRFESKVFTLLNDQQVEALIDKRLTDLVKYWDAPEADIPECTPDDLWMDPPTYKYFSDPSKVTAGGRSTKNFSDPVEANKMLLEKGKGVVITVEGNPKACGYCDAFEICKQKDRYEQL
jgi:hypothetical protein